MESEGIDIILARAMNDPAFADALLADPEKALAEYHLPAEVIAKFKAMSQAEFEALDTDDRRSMSALLGARQPVHKHIANVKYAD